ncbi:hypothetical protein INT45_004752 [Circinella minor]|uniref:Uncharacterized protein n=1 Tax=Circinella minor TaxID=1195481 RepID=A0A8H7SDS6_9FUNG|nr:hypothetical protein INT45_004752 [Circinella minor]
MFEAEVQNLDDDDNNNDDDGDHTFEEELVYKESQKSSSAEQESLSIETSSSTVATSSLSIPSTPTTDVSRTTIRCLEAVITMMSMSSKIDQRVTANDVRKAIYSSTKIPEQACEVASCIIKFIRPFVPKKKNDNSDPNVTVFNLAPFVFLSNKILEAVKLDKQTIAMYPVLQEKQSLHLSARGIYEIFRESHEMYGSDEAVVRDRMHAGRHRLAVLSIFFNMTSIQRILEEHRLRFHLILEYVNKLQICWIGYRITKKQKSSSSSSSKVRNDDDDDDGDKEELQKEIKKLSQEVSRLASLYTKENKILASHVSERMVKSSPYNTLMKKMSREKKKPIENQDKQWLSNVEEEKNVLSKALKEARKKVDDQWLKVSSTHSNLREKRSYLYYLNKKNKNQTIPGLKKLLSTDDLKKFKILVSDPKGTCITGTDPGIVTTTTTTGKTLAEYYTDINRHIALYALPDTDIGTDTEDDDVVMEGVEETSSSSKNVSNITKLVKPVNNSPRWMNSITHSSKHARYRERKKRKKENVKSEKLERDRKTRELRTRKAHERLAAKIRTSFGSSKMSFFHVVGSWVPRNSPIKGHARRSSRKVVEALDKPQGDHVVKVDEFLSSTICPYCFARLTCQTYKRDGKIRISNGSKCCSNPLCPSRSKHWTTMNRDGVGSHNIGLNGVCGILAKDGLALPPLRRSAPQVPRKQENNLKKIFISQLHQLVQGN